MLQPNNLISTKQNSKKVLFILCGFPYAGKSYIASQLRLQTDIQVVSIDDVFKAKGFDWDTNVLPNAEEWQQIFNESYEKTKVSLEQDKNVLYDSTNQTVVSRDILRKVAYSVSAETRVVYVKTPIETIWQRWEKN